jgi:hypothetical protein
MLMVLFSSVDAHKHTKHPLFHHGLILWSSATPTIGHKVEIYLTFTGWPWMNNVIIDNDRVGFAIKLG